jgi:hypothetical protein
MHMNIAEQWNVMKCPIAVFDTHAQIWHCQNVPSTSALKWGFLQIGNPLNLLVDIFPLNIAIFAAKTFCEFSDTAGTAAPLRLPCTASNLSSERPAAFASGR